MSVATGAPSVTEPTLAVAVAARAAVGDAAHVLFVHAHPDDETLATGALILALGEAGVRVSLLTATRGERGEVVPALRDAVGDAGALTRLRERELAHAVERLGIGDAHLLGRGAARAAGRAERVYADSGMRWVTPTFAGPAADLTPDALTAADPAEVTADILALLTATRPDLVVSYDDAGGYGHPDHVFIRATAVEAARQAGVPFAEVVPADAADAVVVDATPLAGRLLPAMHAHATQFTVDGDEVVHCGGQREPIRLATALRLV